MDLTWTTFLLALTFLDRVLSETAYDIGCTSQYCFTSYMDPKRLDWWQAKGRCEVRGGVLAPIPDQATQNLLQEHIHVRYQSRHAEWRHTWIGGTVDQAGDWQWVNGQLLQQSGLDRSTSYEPCGYLWAEDGTLRQQECSKKLPFICQNKDFTVIENNNPTTWYEARAICWNMSSELLVLPPIPNNTVKTAYWVGLRVYRWTWLQKDSAQVELSYYNWDEGQPSTATERCMAIQYQGTWDDNHCNEMRFSFICANKTTATTTFTPPTTTTTTTTTSTSTTSTTSTTTSTRSQSSTNSAVKTPPAPPPVLTVPDGSTIAANVTPPAQPTTPGMENSTLHNGTIAGIAAGAVFIALLFLVILFIYRRFCRKQRVKDVASSYQYFDTKLMGNPRKNNFENEKEKIKENRKRGRPKRFLDSLSERRGPVYVNEAWADTLAAGHAYSNVGTIPFPKSESSETTQAETHRPLATRHSYVNVRPVSLPNPDSSENNDSAQTDVPARHIQPNITIVPTPSAVAPQQMASPRNSAPVVQFALSPPDGAKSQMVSPSPLLGALHKDFNAKLKEMKRRPKSSADIYRGIGRRTRLETRSMYPGVYENTGNQY